MQTEAKVDGYKRAKKEYDETPDALLLDANAADPISRITLIGLCTDICVISNAMLLKAAFPEAPIAVDSSCSAGVTLESHNIALDAMRAVQIEII